MRKFKLSRETSETKITVEINLDEYTNPEIETNIKFFNHLLEQLAFHSLFGINIKAHSLDKDPHHLIEDVSIALGKAFNEALGSKINIKRYGYNILPMDEALILTSLDLCGRSCVSFDAKFSCENINDMPTEMIKHFMNSFANNSMSTIHIKQLNGSNNHHIAEAIFKSFAQALGQASQIITNTNRTPSTKGVL